MTLFLEIVSDWELAAIILTLLISAYLLLDLVAAIVGRRAPRPYPAPSDLPVLSVVLPVYNEPREVVRKALASWRAVRYPAFELIVADDSTFPLELNDPTIRVLHRADREGFKGGALRNALRQLNPASEWMIVFDADYLVDPDVLVRFSRHFLPGVGGIQGYMAMGANGHASYLTTYSEAFHGVAKTLLAGRYRLHGFVGVQGSVQAYRVAAIREIGGIAPEITANEDLDTTFRFRKAGWKIVYDPEIVGRGVAPERYSTFFSQITRWTSTTVREYRRHWASYLRERSVPRIEKIDSFFFLLTWVNSLLVTPTLAFLPWALLFLHLIPLWLAVLITALPVAVFLLPTFDGLPVRVGVTGVLGYYYLLLPGYFVMFRAALLGLFSDPGFSRTDKESSAPALDARAGASPSPRPLRADGTTAVRGGLRRIACRSCGRTLSHSDVAFYAISALDVGTLACRKCLGTSEWARFSTTRTASSRFGPARVDG